MQNKIDSCSLIHWYNHNKRALPFRSTKDPYKIWISEIMLQQTQVKTVIPFFNNFIDKIPNLEKLSTVNNFKLIKCWEGLGYYSRARNLKKAAQQIISEFGGKFWNSTFLSPLPDVIPGGMMIQI